MLDRVTSMQVFARVAASGSFSAAARQLGLSQTMVTKHVAAIEARLGVKLLHRSTRRLTLTEAGRGYLDACERILADLEEAEALATRDRVEPRGTLRLNVPLSFGVREVAPALADFARAYPAVSVDLGLNDRYVDLVDEGWDMAVRIGKLADSSLVARRLAPCRTMVCAAPAYLAAHGTPRTVADLAGHNCMGYTLPSAIGADRWAFGPDGEVVVPVSGNLRASNGDALVAAALAEQGLIYQPTFLVGDAIRAGQLVPVHLDHPTFERLAVHALWPSARQAPAKVRAFIEFLARRFAPKPPWDRALTAADRSAY
jgi:DNA-binding transcriptional LysR family regulator